MGGEEAREERKRGVDKNTRKKRRGGGKARGERKRGNTKKIWRDRESEFRVK